MKRLLPPLLVLLAAAQLRAAIEVGSSIEEVLNELGDPRIRLVLGSQEELTFTNKVRILVVNGKVVEIHNKAALQAKGATPATPPSSAAPPATKTVRASTPEDTSPVNVAALKVEGKVTYKGKTIPLKSACGQWRNKNSNLCLWIFPFELTAEEAGMFKDSRMWIPEGVNKSSPDPVLWSWTPFIRLDAYFAPGTTAFNLATMTRATLSFRGFEEEKTTSTISGDGFKFHKDFRSLILQGTNFMNKVEFSVKSSDLRVHHYALEVQGKSLILDFDGKRPTKSATKLSLLDKPAAPAGSR